MEQIDIIALIDLSNMYGFGFLGVLERNVFLKTCIWARHRSPTD